MADHIITRRDFLNGSLLAAGGASVGGSFPLRAFAQQQRDPVVSPATTDELDPRMARGGNLPAAFRPAHWLIAQRLRFDKDSVDLLPGDDEWSGRFAVEPEGDQYDVVVVGGGLSGLAAAFYLSKQHPNARILILEANSAFGGNAGRDEGYPLAVPASTAGSYIAAPEDGKLYRSLGIDWERYVLPSPANTFFFDDHTPYASRGARRWVLDAFGRGVDEMPYPPNILADMKAARRDFVAWYKQAGCPTDPSDDSDPRFDYLDRKTLHDYLTNDKGFHPAVSDFYSVYSADALGGTTKQVSAHAGISFLSAEYHPIFTFPGGTNGLARGFVRSLVPGAFAGTQAKEWLSGPLQPAALDGPNGRVRIRLNAVALRADSTRDDASVAYFHDKRFRRVQAKAVVLAGQGYSSRRMIDHLLDEPAREAWRSFSYVPIVTANVALRRAEPLVRLGLGFGQFYWGSQDFVCFSVADWGSPQRTRPDRPTVLTFYGGNWRPPEEMQAERTKLLTTPFSRYEASLRADLQRLLAGTGFEFDRDVAAIFVYRWGHAMVYPKPGFAFGEPTLQAGRSVRNNAPRHVARRPLNRIGFAGQDVEGAPAVESAMGSGLRVARELDRYL
jgi:spermidine dehydrogenase